MEKNYVPATAHDRVTISVPETGVLMDIIKSTVAASTDDNVISKLGCVNQNRIHAFAQTIATCIRYPVITEEEWEFTPTGEELTNLNTTRLNDMIVSIIDLLDGGQPVTMGMLDTLVRHWVDTNHVTFLYQDEYGDDAVEACITERRIVQTINTVINSAKVAELIIGG